MNLLFHTLLFCFFYLTCFIPNFIRLKIKCAAGYNFAFRYFRTSYLPRIIPRFTDAPLILAKDLSMAGNVQEKQLRWYNIALMSFITVWGFGNVVNNYANQGLVVVFSWVFIFALYFTPY
ncbi:TPA: amino acid permease, partial [Escherichia coli]